MKKPTNPFPGLCLRNGVVERADKVSLSIQISDPELDFVVKRLAKADGVTVEEFCKQCVLSIVESLEDEYENHIDPDTGLVRFDVWERVEENYRRSCAVG